jgi:hypothetical protein
MKTPPKSSSKTLEHKLHSAIRHKTKSGVKDLTVVNEEKRVVIHGRAATYYVAQLALSAAQNVLRAVQDNRPLRTKIVVDPTEG